MRSKQQYPCSTKSLSPYLCSLTLCAKQVNEAFSSFSLGRLGVDKHGISGRVFQHRLCKYTCVRHLLLLLESKYSLDYTSSFRVFDANKLWIHDNLSLQILVGLNFHIYDILCTEKILAPGYL